MTNYSHQALRTTRIKENYQATRRLNDSMTIIKNPTNRVNTTNATNSIRRENSINRVD